MLPRYDATEGTDGFVSIEVNPHRADDTQATIDEVSNESWNTIWDVRTQRSEEGYTIEMAIPFKSLRYAGAGPQVWGALPPA